MKMRSIYRILSLLMILSVCRVNTMDRQAALQKARELQVWLSNNKANIIKLGAAVTAILGAGYLSKKAAPRLRVVNVYQKYNVELSNDLQIRNAMYKLGILAHEDGIEGLMKTIRSKPEVYGSFIAMIRHDEKLIYALAELANVSVNTLVSSLQDISKTIK